MDYETNPVFGIDFGTSFSRVARWTSRGPVLCPLSNGRSQTPSTAYLDLGERQLLLGDLALARGLLCPECVVSNIKRHLGKEGYALSLGGKVLTPTDVVADMLAALVSDVERNYTTGVFRLAGAVITHPYCFKYPQIAALRSAAEKAGITILRLVPDTVVVPLVYQFGIEAKAKDDVVVIFDLGGGSLDVTVLNVVFESQRVTVDVIVTEGDDHLGGTDFDEALVERVLDRAGLDLSELDETTRLPALMRLREAATNAKRMLSAMDSCRLTVCNVVPGRHIDIDLKRTEAEEAWGTHLWKIRQIVEDAIARSGLAKRDVGRVVTTGDASRMPAVARLVADATGLEPYFMDPGHAVACGAAALAAAEASRAERGEFVLNLQTPHAIGLRTADEKFSTLIPERSRIPCEVTRDLRTTAREAAIQLDVFQGSWDENTKIGAVTISEYPRDGGLLRVSLAVDAQQMVWFRIETDAGTTRAMLSVPGSTLSEAPAAERRTFCQEAWELIKELERATEILPTPMARVAAQVTLKARAGEPPDGSDAAWLLGEWFRFALDCLLADYVMGGRHDIEVLQLLTRGTKDDPGVIRIALTERLIALAKQGHVAAEAPVLVEAAETLLDEVRNVVHETRPPVASRAAPLRGLDETECRRLIDLTRTAIRAIDGFVIYAGYGDSVYRFQGVAPTRVSAPDALSVRHGECVLVNRQTDQSLLLSPLWEIREGPTLRRRQIADDLPSLREWTVERTRIVLVNVPLQNLIVDAIMVTNDSNLGMGTITAASVAQVAGEEFRRGTLGKHVEFGDVVSTPAGALAVKEVYHACAIGGNRLLQSDDLRSLLGKVLRMVATSGHSSLAFPLVGASYGIQATDIAVNYVRVLQEHAHDSPLPSLIVLSAPHANDPIADEVASAIDAYEERAAFASRKAHVFISANHLDYKYATQLHRFLRSRGVAAFFSQESLPQLGSSDYRKEIDRALDDAQYMIVVTSSVENVQSSWVEAEWGFFINEKRSGRKSGNIVTLAVGSLQPSGLPPSLRYYEVLPFQPEAFEKLLRYLGG